MFISFPFVQVNKKLLPYECPFKIQGSEKPVSPMFFNLIEAEYYRIRYFKARLDCPIYLVEQLFLILLQSEFELPDLHNKQVPM